MPKGVYERKPRKPKQYPPDMVRTVSEKYSAGMTQHEIAIDLNVTQKIVFNVMRHHQIPTRVAAKRDQKGEKNNRWKGEQASYAAFHFRVDRILGKPKHCEVCQTADESKRYEWANLTGRYDDIRDYKRMCVSCHRKYDMKRRLETGQRTSPRNRKGVQNA